MSLRIWRNRVADYVGRSGATPAIRMFGLLAVKSALAMHLALIRMSFQRQMTYRAAALAGLVTNAFFGVLHAYILVALFGARDNVAGYSIPAAVTYVVLTQALIGYIAIWGWWEIVQSIRSGDIGGDLARPMDYFTYWAMRDIGRALAQALLRGVTIMLFFSLFFPVLL